jgi:subtilase family serine protease
VTKPGFDRNEGQPTVAIAPSGSFSVTDAVKNQGTIAPASTARYYFSLDNTKGSGDILLTGTRPVGTVVAGGTSSASATVTVPSTTALKTYFLLACADDPLKVPETNETNNCVAAG